MYGCEGTEPMSDLDIWFDKKARKNYIYSTGKLGSMIGEDELVQVASEEKDNATQDFLWQFVREQVEDEANVLNIVSHLRKAGDCAILFMDAKLGERES